VRERQALDAAEPQLDPSTLNCGRVSGRGLFDHFLGAINARDLARRGLFREQLNANTRSETNFQYSVARLNVQQFDNAGSDRSIGPGHYDATELSQDAFRPTERAHRQALQRTRPPAYRLLHPQWVCTTETERRLHRRHAIRHLTDRGDHSMIAPACEPRRGHHRKTSRYVTTWTWLASSILDACACSA